MEVDKSLFQKEITCPFSGQKFLIRRVRFKQFMQEVGGLPLPMATAVQDMIADLQEKAKAGDNTTEEKVTRFYIERGVVSPKVWFGAEAECPPDQVYCQDLGGDLDVLATEVINYSNGLTGVRAMENFFPGSGATDPGSNGASLQPEAVKPAAEGSAE